MKTSSPGGQLLVDPDLGGEVNDAAPDLHVGSGLDTAVDVPRVAGGQAAHHDHELSAGVGGHIP